MLYILLKNDRPVAVTSESPYTGTPKLKNFPGIDYTTAQSRWDWESYEAVQKLAEQLNSLGEVNCPTASLVKYLAIDAGPAVFPRFDIIVQPKIGDPVSYGFNGDYYPDGHITKISPKLMITTSTGTTYRRRKNSGSWMKAGGTWSLVRGHHDERNPHF